MKKIIPLALCGALTLPLAQAESEPVKQKPLAAPAAAAPAAPAGYLVDVGGVRLTQPELDRQLDRAVAQQAAQVPPQFHAQIRAQMQGRVLEGFINRTLLVQEAGRLKLGASAEELAATMKEITDSLPPNLTLEQALKMSGTDQASMLKEIEADMAIRKLVDQQLEKIPEPNEAAISKQYESAKDQFSTKDEVSASHILLKTDPAATAEQKAARKQELEALRTQIVGGAKFAEVASEHSDCPSKARGGSLGTFGRGQMVPEFETAAFGQKLEEVGPIFETQFGYHFVQVTARTEARTKPLKEVREDVVGMLKNEQLRGVMDTLLEGLRGKATITYGDKPLAAAPPPVHPGLPIPAPPPPK